MTCFGKAKRQSELRVHQVCMCSLSPLLCQKCFTLHSGHKNTTQTGIKLDRWPRRVLSVQLLLYLTVRYCPVSRDNLTRLQKKGKRQSFACPKQLHCFLMWTATIHTNKYCYSHKKYMLYIFKPYLEVVYFLLFFFLSRLRSSDGDLSFQLPTWPFSHWQTDVSRLSWTPNYLLAAHWATTPTLVL